MVGSRHLQGTILSRIKHLIDSLSLKKAPVWYDVVRRFPPPSTSLLSLVAVEDNREVPKIMYPMDEIKREFYVKHFRAARDPESLFIDIKTPQSKTDIFLQEYQKLVDAGAEHNEAFEKASEFFKEYLNRLREEKPTKLSKQYEEQYENHYSLDQLEEVDLGTNDIYDLFNNRTKKQ